MDNPLLHFMMVLPHNPAKTLLKGKLYFRHGAGFDAFTVTSSYIGAQVYGTWDEKRHPIPPTTDARMYHVQTTPSDRSHTKGIRGNAYYITPDPCWPPYQNRGEFFVHFDADGPGSYGCPVFEKRSEWQAFEKTMAELKKAGIGAISLKVTYNEI